MRVCAKVVAETGSQQHNRCVRVRAKVQVTIRDINRGAGGIVASWGKSA